MVYPFYAHIKWYLLGLLVFAAIGTYMIFKGNRTTKIENFDELWALGEPAIVEQRFHELLPQAEVLSDKSEYLQILSQLALAQALQKKFADAHATLDYAETLLSPAYELARVRILLERARVYQQAGNIDQARVLFEQAFALSGQHTFDYHTINAAHMIAIVAATPEEKRMWNQRAIDLAIKAKDKRAREWLGSLYNNLGQNYMDMHQFEKALAAFEQALVYREQERYAPNIRVAKWATARAQRMLGRYDEALAIQQALLQQYDAIAKAGMYDMPMQLFALTRGWVYEELAELYHAKMKIFAQQAYDVLHHDEMFKQVEPQRLERLRQLHELDLSNNKKSH
jgi:tetratricopeptide (TPR) repeat protein